MTYKLSLALLCSSFFMTHPMLKKKRRRVVAAECGTDFSPAKRNRAFLVAAEKGNTLFMLKLLRDGADIATTNDKKETALHLAARFGQTETIQALMSSGASETALDQRGRTPFVLAAQSEQHKAIEAMYAESFLLPEIMLVLKDGAVHLPEFFYVSPTLQTIVDELPGDEETIRLPDFTKKQIDLVFNLSTHLFGLYVLQHNEVDPTGIAHTLYTTELYDTLLTHELQDLNLLLPVADMLQIQPLNELLPDAIEYLTLLKKK